MDALWLVNFGGPRSLGEIPEFLTALLCDRDVVRTRLPPPLHRWFFGTIARRRARRITHDYVAIGSKSPIFESTETVASCLAQELQLPVLAFHRYLPATHEDFLARSASHSHPLVLPLFPQFSYATTGSVARWMRRHLPREQFHALRWVPSYAHHPAFLSAFVQQIRRFLAQQNLAEKECCLLFSAHGVPKKFIAEGDPYERECRHSYEQIASQFPDAVTQLAYQSRFGPEEWIQPYTEIVCQKTDWTAGRNNVVVVPLSFTSDHIETLWEVEQQYLPLLRERGLSAWRCPAFSTENYWLSALSQIVQAPHFLAASEMLVRRT